MASVDDYEELIATRKLNGLNDNLYKENNIEEDISILEERIFNYELSIKIGSKDKMISTSIKENEAIKHLLEERKQDKKRIKELEEHLKKYYNGELYTAKQLKNIEENQKKYFINKQKVKDKIEELKNDLKLIACDKDCSKCFNKEGKALYRGSNFVFCYAYHQIKVLEELLEENNK